MSSPAIVPFVKPSPRKVAKKGKPSPRTRRQSFSVVGQVRQTFSKAHRLSAALGFTLGGFIPVAVYVLVHYEVGRYPTLWLMVAGGLLYSAVSVYKWAQQAFQMVAKAVGFVVLVEGTVTFSHTHWLALAGLAVLVSINGISCASALQARAPQAE